MQREILFRGKTTGDIGQWVYGYYNYDDILREHFIADKDSLLRYEVREETVGQYIGWEDQNDVKIFTGDKIEIDWGADISCETITYSEEFGYYMYGNNPICELTEGKVDIEVIGSIHDNPELIKQ